MSNASYTTPYRPTREVLRGQTLVEFALLLPLLLVLFLGIADFGRIFQAGIVAEAAARNAAEIVAEEYRRNPPAPLTEPAPPGNATFYQPLHDLAAFSACAEMRSLASTRYNTATRECYLPDGDPGTSDWMPVIMTCIHDGQDPLCGTAGFGATIPDPQCSALLAPISPAMEGGAEDSRYVEVRICYRFTTLVNVSLLSLGDVWLQRDRAFTVAGYSVPTPAPPPDPPPPPDEPLPSEEPSASASAAPSGAPSEAPSVAQSVAQSEAPSSAPEPTPTPSLEPTATQVPTP
jgi:hypothetical protein